MTAYYQQVLEGTYDNHVLPFLWMKGESHKTIAEYLEKIAGADIHEVCLESRPHPVFCGEGWWRDLRFVIDECKQLGLKLWILDDAHFPTALPTAPSRRPCPSSARSFSRTAHSTSWVPRPPQASRSPTCSTKPSTSTA